MTILESAMMFLADPAKMLFTVTSILIAIISLAVWKKFNKPFLLYTHLIFILSPIFYFALSINCSMQLVQGLLSWCTLLFAKFIIYILPPIISTVFVSGALLIPKLYNKMAKPLSLKLFKQLCKLTSINANLFLIDKAKPAAFTHGKKVYISVGMFELLSQKELEAVLLHELHHVKTRSSWNKFSSLFVKIFSPMAWFSTSSVGREECQADAFAVKIQKTSSHLNSAKKKVESFK